jgi:hypothetical protein
MKAIAYGHYGPLNVLSLGDIPTPAVKDGWVRIRAADLHIGRACGDT